MTEEIPRIMRSRSRLRMELYRKDGHFPVSHSLQCLVIQIYMSDFYCITVECINIDTKTVVLNGYVNFSRSNILYGVVRPMMSEL